MGGRSASASSLLPRLFGLLQQMSIRLWHQHSGFPWISQNLWWGVFLGFTECLKSWLRTYSAHPRRRGFCGFLGVLSQAPKRPTPTSRNSYLCPPASTRLNSSGSDAEAQTDRSCDCFRLFLIPRPASYPSFIRENWQGSILGLLLF